jgi:hypothetical protein
MAAPERQRYALQTIFSFFLGLMVVALVGVGVNTFYQSPDARYQDEMTRLQQQQDNFNRKGNQKTGGLTPAEQAQSDAIAQQQQDLQNKIQAEMKPWMRNTSIVIIILATAVMALSLVRSEQLKVLSNGLLLGGIFTMVYGVGLAIFSGQSIARFAVMVFALAVTVALGYIRFVRGREAAAKVAVAVEGGEAPSAPELAALASRLDALEARAAAAAVALAPPEHAEL